MEIKMPLVYRTHSHRTPLSVKLEDQQDQSFLQSDSSCSVPLKEQWREVNEGRWQDAQNLQFAVFMAYYQDIFASRHKRKHSKIFKNLAQYLGDRTAAQCRSHFQKLLVKYRTVAKIKKHFRSGFGEGVFDSALERFKTQWEQNHKPVRKGPLGVRELKQVAVQTEEIVLKEQPSLRYKNEVFLMHPFAWGVPKMEDCTHPFYYLHP